MTTTRAVDGSRRVGATLAVGIFLLPFIFAWVTLRSGYSNRARAVSFGWLLIFAMLVRLSEGDHARSGDDTRTASQIATDTIVGPQMNAVTDKVARDAADQYAISRSGGDKIEICVRAGMVAAAYLQAKDQANYLKWKDTERSDCNAAGMPKS